MSHVNDMLCLMTVDAILDGDAPVRPAATKITTLTDANTPTSNARATASTVAPTSPELDDSGTPDNTNSAISGPIHVTNTMSPIHMSADTHPARLGSRGHVGD